MSPPQPSQHLGRVGVIGAHHFSVSLVPGDPTLDSRIQTLLEQAGVAVSPNGDLVVVGLPSARRADLSRLGSDSAAGRPVVAVVAEVPSPRAAQVLGTRVSGVVLADEAALTLRPTLEAVSVGQWVMPKSLTSPKTQVSLSNREKQVLAMVVLGLNNAEIAHKLFVTESTVKSHLSSSFGKLGVRSRHAASELILDSENGLGVGILRIVDDSPE